MVNRAPVLTLWAALVAEALGFGHDEALTLKRAVPGLDTYSKDIFLGLFQPTSQEVKERRRKMRKEESVTVDLLHRAVPGKHPAAKRQKRLTEKATLLCSRAFSNPGMGGRTVNFFPNLFLLGNFFAITVNRMSVFWREDLPPKGS